MRFIELGVRLWKGRKGMCAKKVKGSVLAGTPRDVLMLRTLQFRCWRRGWECHEKGRGDGLAHMLDSGQDAGFREPRGQEEYEDWEPGCGGRKRQIILRQAFSP